jgi:integrase
MGPDLGVDEARRQAVLILGGYARDEAAPDPVARRSTRIEAVREPVVRRSAPKPTRQVEPVKQPERARPTVRELAGRFAEEYVAVYLKGGSKANYRRHLAEHILPALGDRDFESVTRSDVQRLHASLRTIPATANYVVNVIGSLYKRIITDWELSDMRHPTHGVKLFKMRVRERFLSPEERQRVHEAMEAGLRIPAGRKGHLEPRSVWALQLLSLTGLRRDEIRDLTWPMVDWQHACLRLPDTKTGQRTVVVPSQVVALLHHIHDQAGNPRAGRVVGSRTGLKVSNLSGAWKLICAAAGIEDVRLHDLRHSFASDALMGGVPLAIVGEMLGHRQVSTTKRTPTSPAASCARRPSTRPGASSRRTRLGRRPRRRPSSPCETSSGPVSPRSPAPTVLAVASPWRCGGWSMGFAGPCTPRLAGATCRRPTGSRRRAGVGTAGGPRTVPGRRSRPLSYLPHVAPHDWQRGTDYGRRMAQVSLQVLL